MNKGDIDPLSKLASELSRYWESGHFVLLNRHGDEVSIVERLTGNVVLIEDDIVYDFVLRKMYEAEVPIVKELPHSAVDYQQRLLDLIDSGIPAKEVNRLINEEAS
jgi:hypothetical protein